MRRSVLLAACLASAALTPAMAAPAPAAPASVATLVGQVDIPFEQFTLPNGLRVVVHTDRKAPVVALSVWYHIGSKDEPTGKTGFAHLFEHLMFYGSENAPSSYFESLESIGATDWNGTTWFDRTNYFETVPTGALDRALFLESDRMGHLLGVVDQTRLDAQRGVVQNEKRMGDNEPGGLVNYTELSTLLPAGHPYRHSTIGSMTDLDAASLEDVKGWFRAHYGPNNAVLVLAGDIDVATARAKATRWFGNIPRGAETARGDVAVPSLPADATVEMHDRVATTSVSREWVGPGVNDPATNQIDLALSILGGLGSSRLEDALVRKEQLAVSVSAGVQAFEKLSFLEINARVRPGVDPKLVGRRIDAILADFLRAGPSADEVQRAATSELAGRVKGLESVGGFGGKAVTLAEGAVYSGDPAKYKKDLAEIAAATPASVGGAARQWLGRPVMRLTLSPGERSAQDVATAGSVKPAMAPAYFRAPAQGGAPAPATPGQTPAPPQTPSTGKIAAPPVLPVGPLAFPRIERAKLSNGMTLVFARRAGLPVVQVAASFDAGNAADDHAKLGTQNLMLSLLDEGTTTRDALAIATEQERLGADINLNASMDRTTVSMFALKPNLGASLDLMADIVRNPAFKPADVERLRATVLARIATEKTQPQAIALRTLPPLLYGTAHPYGVPFTGSGDEAGVKAVTRDDLVAFHQRWVRPDNGTLFVVGDVSLAEVRPLLEARFGSWHAPASPKGTKQFPASVASAGPSRILLIDKPQSPQSMILAGQVLPVKGTEDPVALLAANDVLGQSGASRLSLDLREARHWAYYAASIVQRVQQNMPMLVIAPVQSDQTGASIASARDDVRGFVGARGVTADELGRTVNNLTLSLPGSFESSGDVLGALMRIENFRLPDDYFVKLPARYAALTAGSLDAAARKAIDPDKLVWVVVGDAKVVRPQLAGLGLPIVEAGGAQ